VVVKIVKDYENERRRPKTDRWPTIAQVLGKPVGWFFEDSQANESDSAQAATQLTAVGKGSGRRDERSRSEDRLSNVERLLLERIDQLERREEEARERHEEMMALLLRMAERLGDAPKASRPQLLEPPGRPGRTGEGAGA